MKTLKLYSECKSNKKKLSANKHNHTRLIIALFATLLAIFILASCTSSKYSYSFSDSRDALKTYESLLNDTRSIEHASTEELASLINTWQELGDTVFHFIEKDPAFTAHVNLSCDYYALHDSIKYELMRLASVDTRTLKDVLLIKYNTSVYKDDKEILPMLEKCRKFEVSVDSLSPYKMEKIQTLSLYRSFLENVERKGINNSSDLYQALKEEDRIFKTFLSHLDEYPNESLADITKSTENMCETIYRNANDGKLDCKEVVVQMAMRTNRRLLQNAHVCIESISKNHKLDNNQRQAYFWMIIQPFISIDSFGMSVLSNEQMKDFDTIIHDIETLDSAKKLGDHKEITELCNLILKLYISTL